VVVASVGTAMAAMSASAFNQIMEVTNLLLSFSQA
jgi:hypothetical protein